MRFADLVHYGIRYAVLGCAVALIVTIAFQFGYKIVYQKWMHGKKKIDKWKSVWLIVFVIYGVVLLGATFLSRGSFYTGAEFMPLFASYREAWYQGQGSNVRNIVVNILLFVPLGFLLPLGIKRMKAFWQVTLTGFVVTLFIECLQIVTKRGIFEFDDILNNLVGTIIGYGFFVLVRWLFGKADKKKSVFKVFACQLPLVITILTFVIVYSAYMRQELGNLSIHYITRAPRSQFAITSNLEFEKNPGKAYVYQVKVYSLPETRKMAEEILSKTGVIINDNETDIYDETVFYRGTGKHISIDYKGGLYRYTDFDAAFSNGELTEKSDATEEEIEQALEKLGIQIPQGAVFETADNGQYIFHVNAVEKDGVMYDGQLICKYMSDGSIANIYNNIYVCQPYKEFEIISEQQAYEQIINGEFRFYSSGEAKMVIDVQGVSLQYLLDSKSFYQPVYCFEVSVNGAEYQIKIPAIHIK